MFGVDSQGLTHAVGTSAKCLSAISLHANDETFGDMDSDAEFDHSDDHQQMHTFLVGSYGIHSRRHFLQMVQYQNSDYGTSNELQAVANFHHGTGEVCAMGVANGHDRIVSTCGGIVSGNGSYECCTKIWKLPEAVVPTNTNVNGERTTSDIISDNQLDRDDYYRNQPTSRVITPTPTDDENLQNNLAMHDLEEVLELVHPTNSSLSRILWKPQTDSALVSTFSSGDLVTLGPDGLCLYDINNANKEAISHNGDRNITFGCWNPHDLSMIALGSSTDISLIDIRSMKISQTFEKCHRYSIQDIDYNPNRPFVLASGGEDGLCKFWDLRNMGKPLKIIGGHSHWVTSVKYNRFHDQLFLSTSTDGNADLWRVSSISSSPYTELEGNDATGENSSSVDNSCDICLTKSEHQESIYDAAWSLCDAWVYASLSFEGHVQINLVPSSEKYKILL